MEEAEEETGTWSLATYLKLKSVLFDFSSADASLLVQRAITLINSADCKFTTRYKLAQLLSAIHTQKVPEFERLFSECQNGLTENCDSFAQSGRLGTATAKLLLSLHTKEKPLERRTHPSTSVDLPARRLSRIAEIPGLLRPSASAPKLSGSD
jgi:hypothetical protein